MLIEGYIWQVLDAPALQDDFYLNLVDWSSQNVLAVGLGTCVYLWTASTSKVSLIDISQSYIFIHFIYIRRRMIEYVIWLLVMFFSGDKAVRLGT